MNRIFLGQIITAIKSASGNITIGEKYKIKKIKKVRNNITCITIDLDHLQDYPFDQSTFIYYFGDTLFTTLTLNNNIKIL